MSRTILFVILALMSATAARAECYADYKAKQDNPLRLHYGVAQVSEDSCDQKSAKRVLTKRLANEGWTVLNVLSIFGPEGLEERKASAGEYFLRF